MAKGKCERVLILLSASLDERGKGDIVRNAESLLGVALDKERLIQELLLLAICIEIKGMLGKLGSFTHFFRCKVAPNKASILPAGFFWPIRPRSSSLRRRSQRPEGNLGRSRT